MRFCDPDDLPTGDLYGGVSDYADGWHAIQLDVTDPVAVGTLFVVTGEGEQQWTLVDREPIPFGFGRE